MAKKEKKSVPVAALKHKDKRANIPTRELAGFVVREEQKPYNLLYPRDPSLDPQLVWKGKDEQDRQSLSVPTVPIYIQEKIAPQAIIENLRLEAKRKKAEDEPDLFGDFNGIAFDKLVEFYQHEQNWTNRLILGDSLLVMNSLAEKEGLKGKVQMIYMDPPYGIKFGSNWQVSTRKRDVKDGAVEAASRQPEQVKAFRDTWKDGIHSYLSYLRDRLVLARDLLTDTGSVFVQIGDENLHVVRAILDEVFGPDNFCSLVTVKKTGGLGTELLKGVADYLIWYAKDKATVKYRQLYHSKEQGIGHSTGARYDQVELSNGHRRALTAEEREDATKIPDTARTFQLDNLVSSGTTASCVYPYTYEGMSYEPGGQRSWKTNLDGMKRLDWAKRLVGTGGSLRYVRYLGDFPAYELANIWEDLAVGTDKIYVVQTATTVIQRCILMTTDPGDLVLDPTCGSGTVAFVAEQWGRRWITVDTSRVALALARSRLMAARFPYYSLADPGPNSDLRKGFVYRRVAHVTLRSIANNPEIAEGMSQQAVDAAISRHSETELLYDQPAEDSKRVRVTGSFTVESLSPHRVLTTDEERPASEAVVSKDANAGQFENMILENLKKAGVQNTFKKERLVFDRLEPHAGVYLHGAGEYTENGKSRRAAVCIGPEHGTVGPELVKDAAKEAVKGVGFDLLIVCGFAFDPHTSEEAKQYGKLTVLMARMNPDLAMGDELLKKTGAGNLFTVFGEPDIDVKTQKSGKLVVEIKGVDVYDPTTGQIRSHTTDDIACWFIDTEYNGESFFVRHAYFCGGDEPYDKLKRALRADIDESAWASLYSTKSRPFDPPAKGKIAIKVINHYGDEVLKVYSLKDHP